MIQGISKTEPSKTTRKKWVLPTPLAGGEGLIQGTGNRLIVTGKIYGENN